MGKQIIIEPDLEQRHLRGYYFQSFYCDNCNTPGFGVISHVDVMIPKGQPRPKKLKCPNCEMDTLS